MRVTEFDIEGIDISWCPGCGNFSIHNVIKVALSELGLKPQETVLVSGIGQAAKLPHYVKSNIFNGLHGRTLPVATAVKVVNPMLTVIAVSGDGCMYAEGGNHFIHAIRRNPDITAIIHNNMVYGLTKGQASPTSQIGFKTPVQIEGVFQEPFNPISVAIALDASFVARAYCADVKQTKEILKRAILHKGFSIVDIFQPCVSFNKLNTYEWFKKNTYYLEDDYDYSDRINAFKRSIEADKLPLGIFYINEKKLIFEENVGVYDDDKEPLFKRRVEIEKIKEILENKKRSF